MTFINWDEPLVDRLVHFRSLGLSFGRVAENLRREFQIDITRSACIGKAKRLKLGTLYAQELREYRAKKKANSRARALPPQPLDMQPTPFESAGPRQCRFPLWGDDKSTGDVCGRKADGTYCDFHAALCRPVKGKAA